MTSNATHSTLLIKSGYARVLVELFRETYQDPHHLIEQSGLPHDLFELDQEFVPQEPVKKLIYLLANQLDTQSFGHLLRTAIREKVIPRLIGEFIHCKDIREALEHSREVYQFDAVGVDVGVERSHGRTWYWCNRQYNGGSMYLWAEIWTVIYMIELIRALTSSEWTPKQIKLQASDESIAKAIVGGSVQYFVGSQRIEWLIDESILCQKPNISIDSKQGEQALVAWHGNFTDRVFTALLPYVKEQNLSLDQAAKLLKLSARTLQRKLNDERTSFRHIKDNLVFTVAIEMMEEGHSLTHISSQLGFADLAHFSRSFKRICGLTPKVYRNTILSLND